MVAKGSSKMDETQIPKWFEKSVWVLFDLYHGSYIGKGTVASWWGFLCDISEAALRPSFRLAVNASPDRCPTAAQIRAHALATAKTLVKPPSADLSRPALPEPELTLPADNPFFEKLEAYKRGEIPRSDDERKEAVKDAVRGFSESRRSA